MDQYSSVWKICKTQSIPSQIRKSNDSFVQELIELWDKNRREGTCYTAFLFDIPVGFILLENNSENFKTIRGTWVDSEFRGHGAGKALMNKILSEYEHKNVDIKVNITPGAEEFYTKYGFKIVEHRDDISMNVGLWKAL